MDINGPVKVGVVESSPTGNGRRRVAVTEGFQVQQRDIPLSEVLLEGIQRAPGVDRADLLS